MLRVRALHGRRARGQHHQVHPTIDGWTKDELVEALGYWRAKGKDIKRVWESGRWIEQSRRMTGKWTPEPSKVKLAEALWPTLLREDPSLHDYRGAPVPPIAAVVNDAYHIAHSGGTSPTSSPRRPTPHKGSKASNHSCAQTTSGS